MNYFMGFMASNFIEDFLLKIDFWIALNFQSNPNPLELLKFFSSLHNILTQKRIWIDKVTFCPNYTKYVEHLYYITASRQKSTLVKSYIRADWILCHLPNVIIYEWCSDCSELRLPRDVWNKEGNWISNLSIYSNSVVCSVSDTKPDTDGKTHLFLIKIGKFK